jgi:hypothetical protein
MPIVERMTAIEKESPKRTPMANLKEERSKTRA